MIYMVRYVLLIGFTFFGYLAQSQRLISQEEAVNLALANQRNLRAANLSVQQQQQLVSGAAGIASPQVFGEITPYEPLLLGVQQTFSLPVVYRRNKELQNEMVRLAQLQLQGTQFELKREVRLSYLQLQYLAERRRLLTYQDSIYQAIKTSSKRFFDAGQINKLEELQATTQADAIRNELNRISVDFAGARQIFQFLTGFTDTFQVSPIETYLFVPTSDTSVTNIQQQILQQQITINESQLGVTKASLLPQIQAGVSFPTTREFERPVGAQFGITIPIWRKQNRSQIAAAQTGVELARAQQQLAQQRLNADYRQALANYQREIQSLNYYNSTALQQARAIIETSQRLFQGGELNYIESLRNLQTAFDIFLNHLETHRAYNEAVIQLNYLNGTL
jgi:outer membrane protein, heavy metal efflux system